MIIKLLMVVEKKYVREKCERNCKWRVKKVTISCYELNKKRGAPDGDGAIEKKQCHMQ